MLNDLQPENSRPLLVDMHHVSRSTAVMASTNFCLICDLHQDRLQKAVSDGLSYTDCHLSGCHRQHAKRRFSSPLVPSTDMCPSPQSLSRFVPVPVPLQSRPPSQPVCQVAKLTVSYAYHNRSSKIHTKKKDVCQ